MRRDEWLNLRGKLCGYAVVVFVSMEVMSVVTFEVGKRDFDFIAGSHHTNRVLMMAVDAAMAPLSIRGSRAIPKALTKRTALFSLQQPVCVKFRWVEEGASIFLRGIVILKTNRIDNTGWRPNFVSPANRPHLTLDFRGITVRKLFNSLGQVCFHGYLSLLQAGHNSLW